MNELAERTEPAWILETTALAVHDRQLAEHGGGTGVRDAGALQSALARPRNRWEYGEDEIVVLASAYAFGVARNHPFVDGNKRTAWTIANVFLALNGHELAFDELEAIRTVERLAAGDLSEDELADWFRQHLA
ncbi:MAG: type II toxin-antitoxin system death-on-curing family toxin [Erythrobacter sp.]|uniref:type II toxin-antitoxin system death-on-curing family toxin n=1 Tax=Erythrobacter sp. TaxID=1042 RepID=UPI001B00CF39|nr:type II toxin-antitoxin system death-on-curing family toxin [Erythrobacter sp.]MBO6767484.1 type II toxin-antitoxin system death-on-curing family toxin [Erythrobacter sp.]